MALKSASTAELRRELERRQKAAGRIAARRDQLARKLAQLDAELADLGGSPSARRGRKPGRKPGRRPGRKPGRKPGRRPGASAGSRKRPKNVLTLPDAIAAAMDKGAVISPAEAAGLVKSNGYKTTSKTFNISVSQALTKDKRFKRVGRGQYEKVSA
jgi:hypothetical protein